MAAWMHRIVLLLLFLIIDLMAYEYGLPRLLSLAYGCLDAGHLLARPLTALMGAALLSVFAWEFVLFNSSLMTTPMAAWAIAVVALTLVGLMATGIVVALGKVHDPFGVPENRRTLFV